MRKNKQNQSYNWKIIIIITISLQMIGNIVPYRMRANETKCFHPKEYVVVSDSNSQPMYSGEPDSYCFHILEFVQYTCTKCGATWREEKSAFSKEHNWNESSCKREKQYGNKTAYCSRVIEKKVFCCLNCNITKTISTIISSEPHYFMEERGEFDGKYTYYYNVCTTCGYRVFSRKSEFTEEILHRSYPEMEVNQENGNKD